MLKTPNSLPDRKCRYCNNLAEDNMDLCQYCHDEERQEIMNSEANPDYARAMDLMDDDIGDK